MKHLLLSFLIIILPISSFAQSSARPVIPMEYCPPFGLPGACSTVQRTTIVTCLGGYDCQDQIEITTPGSPRNKCNSPVPQQVQCCDFTYTVWVQGQDSGTCLWASSVLRQTLSTMARSMVTPVLVPDCTGEFIPLKDMIL